MPMAMTMPISAPTSVLSAPTSESVAAVTCPSRKRDVSMPSRMTAVKARIESAQAPPSVRARSMPACSSPLMLADGAAHPEEHPGHDGGGQQHGSPLEDLLRRRLKPADASPTAPAPITDADAERRHHARPDATEIALVAGLGQVGEHDAHDQGRLDALAEAGEQPGRQESSVQRRHLLREGGRSPRRAPGAS